MFLKQRKTSRLWTFTDGKSWAFLNTLNRVGLCKGQIGVRFWRWVNGDSETGNYTKTILISWKWLRWCGNGSTETWGPRWQFEKTPGSFHFRCVCWRPCRPAYQRSTHYRPLLIFWQTVVQHWCELYILNHCSFRLWSKNADQLPNEFVVDYRAVSFFEPISDLDTCWFYKTKIYSTRNIRKLSSSLL